MSILFPNYCLASNTTLTNNIYSVGHSIKIGANKLPVHRIYLVGKVEVYSQRMYSVNGLWFRLWFRLWLGFGVTRHEGVSQFVVYPGNALLEVVLDVVYLSLIAAVDSWVLVNILIHDVPTGEVEFL